MSENKTNSFWFGFLAGLSITSIIAFSFLFALMWRNNSNNSIDLGSNDNKEITNNNNAPSQNENSLYKIAKASPVRKEDHVMGNKDAKVTVIVYSDFECPFCGRFYNTFKEIEEKYKGKLRIVFRHFPLSFHQHAMDAAIASECAADQGKFWEMHDKLFEANLAKRLGEDKIWESLAKEIGLNITQFNNCMKNNADAKKKKIQADESLGQKDGVQGTPSVFVNDKMVVGALPFDAFAQVIDEELAK